MITCCHATIDHPAKDILTCFDCNKKSHINPRWRPTCFQSELFGCRAGLEFPIVKLLDFSEEIENLEASPNPFAVVTACQLKAMASGKADDNSRFELKMGLIRRLYGIGFNRQQVIDLFAFIDWVITLSEEFENKIMYTIEQLERSENMRYVTSAERYYKKKWMNKGLEMGVELGLEKGMVNSYQQGRDDDRFCRQCKMGCPRSSCFRSCGHRFILSIFRFMAEAMNNLVLVETHASSACTFQRLTDARTLSNDSLMSFCVSPARAPRRMTSSLPGNLPSPSTVMECSPPGPEAYVRS